MKNLIVSYISITESGLWYIEAYTPKSLRNTYSNINNKEDNLSVYKKGITFEDFWGFQVELS